MNVQLILSQHDFQCATCVRSGNCTLQTLSNDLNIIDLPFKERRGACTVGQELPTDPRYRKVHQVHALRPGLRQGAGPWTSGM